MSRAAQHRYTSEKLNKYGESLMAMDDTDRLRHANWILERNLHWIAAAEVKMGAIIAIDTAMLGYLMSSFTAVASNARTAFAYLYSGLAGLFLSLAILHCAMTVIPRLTGPAASMIFFGRVKELKYPDYRAKFLNADAAEHLDDCLAQVHRNAEIAFTKHRLIRIATLWSIAAIMPWVCGLYCLLKAAHK
jgi:hypothetical protein